MNKKIFWFGGFVLAAALSCWATTRSWQLMMPNLFSSDNAIVSEIATWLLAIMLYVLASLSMKWVVEASNNDGDLEHPKLQLWGGLAALAVTWLVLLFPTNAHTFFYNLKIEDVVTEDLATTRGYSQQLAKREVTDSAYYQIEEKVGKEWKSFQDEVKAGLTGSGIGKYAASHITTINDEIIVDPSYSLPMPTNTNVATDDYNTAMINTWHNNYLVPTLERLKSDKYKVSKDLAAQCANDVEQLDTMKTAIDDMVKSRLLSSRKGEAYVIQTEKVLGESYSHIKNGAKYVKFKDDKDKKLYTAENVETKTHRFFNPYSVMYDFFTGKIPFTFIIWLVLALAIDLAGFFFYYQFTKKSLFVPHH